MKYVLGIDLGTSGTKTVLFDQYGTAVCSALVEYPLYQPHNGWAEQKPEDWYHAAVDTIRSVLTKSGVDKKDVVSMGISGQMHGLVMLDEAGNVLRPSIIWCDQRTAAECDQIHEIVGRDQLIAITANPALTGFTLSKLLWVRNHEPEVYAKCRHILLPKDYVRYMLTGDFATEVSDASGMQMLDVPNRCWSEKLLNMLNIDPSLLAKVYESCEVTGHISKAAAELTGLSEDTLVVGGAGSLYVDPEHTATLDQGPDFPDIFKPVSAAHGEALDFLRTQNDVRWTYVSPAADFRADGARTGEYTLGGEELTLNAAGQSVVSYADFAIAMVDEAVAGAHVGRRISVVSK